EFSSGGIGFRHNDKSEEAVAYWDDFKIDTNEDSGLYLSDTHEVTNATDGVVEIATLSNVDATVTWQENSSGTWSNISSSTFTTAGTKTADISSATTSHIRVRVDFQQNGSNPVAEVDRDFVRFQNQQPTASGPSLSGGSTTRTSQPNLSVTVDDPEF
ncbi:hypothetical protein, partial [Halorubrum sp. Atlit-26R]